MPHSIPARESQYYPPRRGAPRFLRRSSEVFRAALQLERLCLPRLPRVLPALAAVVVPGLAFHLRGPRWIARVIWMTLPVLVLVFLAGLGTFAAEMAFGLIIGIHVASVSHLMRPWLGRSRFVMQAMLGVVLFLAAAVLVYVPVREWFHRAVALPLTVRDQVLIINPRADAASVQRGDVVVYRIEAWSGRNVFVQAGLGVEPVLGLPGDRLVFGDGRVYVNGKVHALPGSSREWGTTVVPGHCWFIWPGLQRSNRGVAVRQVEEAVRQVAWVNRAHFVGRPYRWWFFRKQGSAT